MVQAELDTPQPASRPPVLKLSTLWRTTRRRIPGVGECVFGVLSLAQESDLAPFYEETEADPRRFVNILIAACVQEPSVSAAEVDLWSDRVRATGRAACAQVLDLSSAYRRRRPGLDGDERLLVAMRERRERTLASLNASMRSIRGLMLPAFDPSRIFAGGALQAALANHPTYLGSFGIGSRGLGAGLHTQMSPLSLSMKSILGDTVAGLARSQTRTIGHARLTGFASLNTQLSSWQRSGAGALLAQTLARSQLPARDSFGVMGQIDLATQVLKSFASLESTSLWGALASTRIAPPADLARLMESLSPSRSLNASFAGVFRTSALAHQAYVSSSLAASLAALSRVSASSYLGVLGSPTYLETLRTNPQWLLGDRFRDLFRFVDWLAAEWEATKESRNPFLFLIESLEPHDGIRVYEAVRADEEVLIPAIEGALAEPGVVDSLQVSLQASPWLDDDTKDFFVRGLDFAGKQDYVIAAPLLAHGLERALRHRARHLQVIGADNRFLLPAESGRQAKSVEEVFRHLGLSPRFNRFLNTRVFGTRGNPVRHADLSGYAEYRCWVLHAIVAIIGWLEEVEGESAAVAGFARRLDIDIIVSADTLFVDG